MHLKNVGFIKRIFFLCAVTSALLFVFGSILSLLILNSNRKSSAQHFAEGLYGSVQTSLLSLKSILKQEIKSESKNFKLREALAAKSLFAVNQSLESVGFSASGRVLIIFSGNFEDAYNGIDPRPCEVLYRSDDLEFESNIRKKRASDAYFSKLCGNFQNLSDSNQNLESEAIARQNFRLWVQLLPKEIESDIFEVLQSLDQFKLVHEFPWFLSFAPIEVAEKKLGYVLLLENSLASERIQSYFKTIFEKSQELFKIASFEEFAPPWIKSNTIQKVSLKLTLLEKSVFEFGEHMNANSLAKVGQFEFPISWEENDIGNLKIGIPYSSLLNASSITFIVALVLTLILQTLFVLAFAIVFFRKSILQMRSIAKVAKAFGEGDTTARCELNDSTEIGQLGKAFDTMAAQTAAQIMKITQLENIATSHLARISHEFRTPLQTLLWQVDAIEELNILFQDDGYVNAISEKEIKNTIEKTIKDAKKNVLELSEIVKDSLFMTSLIMESSSKLERISVKSFLNEFLARENLDCEFSSESLQEDRLVNEALNCQVVLAACIGLRNEMMKMFPQLLQCRVVEDSAKLKVSLKVQPKNSKFENLVELFQRQSQMLKNGEKSQLFLPQENFVLLWMQVLTGFCSNYVMCSVEESNIGLIEFSIDM